MIAPTPGVRPGLLAFLVAAIALAVLAPWLSARQWDGEAALAVRAVEEGRPFSQPDRAGYLILGMAADAIFPSSTSRDMNLLGLVAGVGAALAVARLRSVLARGGVAVDRLIEPVASALALLAAGPFLSRAVSADRVGVETLLAAAAAALAWTRRLPAAMTVFGILLFVSSRSLLSLPILIAAPRPRGDLVPSLGALIPWLGYMVLIRVLGHGGGDGGLFHAGFWGVEHPGQFPHGGESIALGVGLGGVLAVAAIGMAVGILRGGPHRRFAAAVAATLILVTIVLAPRVGMIRAAVLVIPWLAVLAGSGVASLRRAAARIPGARLGPLGAGLGFILLVSNLALAVRHHVGPVWRDAKHFERLCDALQEPGMSRRVAGTWADLMLEELTSGLRKIRWQLVPGPPLPEDRPPDIADRLRLDTEIRRGDLLILSRRFAAPLGQDSLGVEQIFEDRAGGAVGAAQPTGSDASAPSLPPENAAWLAEFGQQLVLERTELMLPPSRRAGELINLRLYWRAKWKAGAAPSAPDRRDRPAESLKVGTAVVDSRGRVEIDLSHWLALGLLGLGELGDRRFSEVITFQTPVEWKPGDYGIEVGVYEPKPGDGLALDLDLGFSRQRRYAARSGGVPHGITPSSVRAATFRLQPAALAAERRQDTRVFALAGGPRSLFLALITPIRARSVF